MMITANTTDDTNDSFASLNDSMTPLLSPVQTATTATIPLGAVERIIDSEDGSYTVTSPPTSSPTTTRTSTNTTMLNNSNNDDDRLGQRRKGCCHIISSLIADEQGSLQSIIHGFSILVIIGIIIGLITTSISLFFVSKSHKEDNSDSDNTILHQYVSNCIGYIYFICWSISFYPQVIQNYRQKSTRGLSIDFCILNILGFIFYTIYNTSMFYNPMIRRLYWEKYHQSITIQSNDVAFAIHALLLSIITVFQIILYNVATTTNDDRRRRFHRPSKLIICIILIMILIATIYPFIIMIRKNRNNDNNNAIIMNDNTNSKLLSFELFHLDWLNYIYLLSYMKIMISLIKYIPQVILNYKRQSTIGWSIWQILLDCFGGTLSILQLVYDCTAPSNSNFGTCMEGNITKFCLGFVSILFDLIFMTQHYILYPHPDNNNTNDNNMNDDYVVVDVVNNVVTQNDTTIIEHNHNHDDISIIPTDENHISTTPLLGGEREKDK